MLPDRALHPRPGTYPPTAPWAFTAAGAAKARELGVLPALAAAGGGEDAQPLL